ncbi:uncharacterized protein LOC144155555 [Haemaphysalis longicornis]
MRSVILISLCVVALAGLSRADDDDHEPVQQVAVGPRPSNLEDGSNCSSNEQCQSKCCLKVFKGDGAGSPGECRAAAGPGERCSLEQVKGGANVNFCPCRVGICGDDDICPSEESNSGEDDH